LIARMFIFTQKMDHLQVYGLNGMPKNNNVFFLVLPQLTMLTELVICDNALLMPKIIGNIMMLLML
jgi:hypothetical protein